MKVTKTLELARPFVIDVNASGHCTVRERGKAWVGSGGIPVFSTDTKEQAETLIATYAKRQYDGSMRLNNPPRSTADLPEITELFRKAYERMLAVRA